MRHTSKRISCGHYLYRGYHIKRYKSQGLMPNRQWVWEASDSQEVGVTHAHSLTMVKKLIDDMLDKEFRVYTNRQSFKDDIELAKSLGFFKGGNILNTEKENKEG